MTEGQIYKIHSDFYYIDDGKEFHECKVREILKKQKEKIFVGDFVEFDNGVITKILPRKNFIKRPSVANISQVVIVSALKEPDLDMIQLNRYIALAKYYNIDTVLCFNKEDLKWDKKLKDKIQNIYLPWDTKSFLHQQQNIKELKILKNFLKGKLLFCAGTQVLENQAWLMRSTQN